MLHRNETDNRRIPRRRLTPQHSQRAADPARIERTPRFSFFRGVHLAIDELSYHACAVLSCLRRVVARMTYLVREGANAIARSRGSTLNGPLISP